MQYYSNYPPPLPVAAVVAYVPEPVVKGERVDQLSFDYLLQPDFSHLLKSKIH
jgi:hypothetical protein